MSFSTASSFNFTMFKEQYKALFSKDAPNNEFLEWLIGFTEGDGAFVVNHRGDCSFIQIQGDSNKEIQNKISRIQGFGRVIKQGPRVWRYVVESHAELNLLVLLFNGNLIQVTRRVQFKHFQVAFNVKVAKRKSSVIKYVSNKNLISLDTCWQLGFTEAEGCFTISFLRNSKAFRTRFVLTQKGKDHLLVFSELIKLFGVGVIRGHSAKNDIYDYIVSGQSNVIAIYDYFDKYIDHFLGTKKDSYLKFKNLNNRIANKEHQNPDCRKSMIVEATAINPFYVRKSKLL